MDAARPMSTFREFWCRMSQHFLERARRLEAAGRPVPGQLRREVAETLRRCRGEPPPPGKPRDRWVDVVEQRHAMLLDYWAKEIRPFLKRAEMAEEEGRCLREHFRRDIEHTFHRSHTELTPEGASGSWWWLLLEQRYAALPGEELKTAFRLGVVDLLDTKEAHNAIGLCGELLVHEAAPKLEGLLEAQSVRRETPRSASGLLLWACARLRVRSVVPVLQQEVRRHLQDMGWEALRAGEDLESFDVDPFASATTDIENLAYVDWREALTFLVELLRADLRWLDPVGPETRGDQRKLAESSLRTLGDARFIFSGLRGALDILLRVGGEEVLECMGRHIGPVEARRKEFILDLAHGALGDQDTPRERLPGLEVSPAQVEALVGRLAECLSP